FRWPELRERDEQDPRDHLRRERELQGRVLRAASRHSRCSRLPRRLRHPAVAAARCSSARYEERTSGPEKTDPKPSASPCSRNQRNSPGCTQRSIAACVALGCRYWPVVTTSTPWARTARTVSAASSLLPPPAPLSPDSVSPVC